MTKQKSSGGRAGSRALLWGVGGALIAILVAIVFWSRLSGADPAGEALRHEERRYAENSPEEGQGKPARILSLVDRDRLTARLEKQEVLTPRVLLSEYRLYYRYPPASRPLSRRMKDLVDPWKVEPSREPLYENMPPQPGEKPRYFFSWSGPTWMVTGRDPATATLTVYPADTETPAAIQIVSGSVFADPEFGGVKIGDAEVKEDGKGGYTFRWVPQAGRKLDWGDLRMAAKFSVPGGKTYEVDTRFRSTPNPPAAFTGDFQDHLKDGSLHIEAGIKVEKAGRYIVQAGLFDDTNRPLHWFYARLDLERGLQTVDLVFFGLVFHDQDFSSGRLVLRDLRAYRHNLPYDPRKLDDMLARGQSVPTTHEPDQEWVVPVASYTTKRPYKIEEFSRLEYQGEDKAARLKHIREYAREWEKNHGAGPESKID